MELKIPKYLLNFLTNGSDIILATRTESKVFYIFAL